MSGTVNLSKHGVHVDAVGGRAMVDAVDAAWDANVWHEYSVEWDGSNRIAFIVDGATILNITRANVTNSTRYVVISVSNDQNV